MKFNKKILKIGLPIFAATAGLMGASVALVSCNSNSSQTIEPIVITSENANKLFGDLSTGIGAWNAYVDSGKTGTTVPQEITVASINKYFDSNKESQNNNVNSYQSYQAIAKILGIKLGDISSLKATSNGNGAGGTITITVGEGGKFSLETTKDNPLDDNIKVSELTITITLNNLRA